MSTTSHTVAGEYLPYQLNSYQQVRHHYESHPIEFHFQNDDTLSPPDVTTTNHNTDNDSLKPLPLVTITPTPACCEQPVRATSKANTVQPGQAAVTRSLASFSHDDSTIHRLDFHATSPPLQHQIQRLVSIDELRNELSRNQNDAIKLLVHAIQAQTAAKKMKWGNPGGLGLGGFASTTFILSAYNTTLLDEASFKMVLPMALWFGGVAQLLAGVFEFAIGNTFGGTAFVGYGSFWLSYCTFVEFAIPQMVSSGATTWQLNQSIAFYLMMWLIFSIYMMIASFRQSKALAAVFVTLVITFSLLVAGNYAQDANTVKAGGYFGLLCAALAFYGSAAAIINNSFGYSALPLGVYERPAPSKTFQ